MPDSDSADSHADLEFPIELIGPEPFIKALMADGNFIATTGGTAAVRPTPDVSSHEFDLASVLAVGALIQRAFDLVKLAPLIQRLFARNPTSTLYIRTPQMEITLTAADAQQIAALEKVLQTLK